MYRFRFIIESQCTTALLILWHGSSRNDNSTVFYSALETAAKVPLVYAQLTRLDTVLPSKLPTQT